MKVFISYSHDSKEYRHRVGAFAQKLREDGIDAQVDLFVYGHPPEGWPRWMEKQMKSADYILIVCSKGYFDKFNIDYEKQGGLGVAFESIITRNDFYRNKGYNEKYIPIILKNEDFEYIPDLFRSVYNSYNVIEHYDLLINHLNKKPIIAPNPLKQTLSKSKRINENIQKGDYNLSKLALQERLHKAFYDLDNKNKMLAFIWLYPYGNEARTSWAVKESQIILGNLKTAEEEPGLGLAIFSIELCLKIFSYNNCRSRINRSINWGISRAQKKPPFLMEYDEIDKITTETEKKQDFRHTISLGIILSKTRMHDMYLKEYLLHTLRAKQEGGYWLAGSGKTKSEVFTVMYVIELLVLNLNTELLSKNNRVLLKETAIEAINWLLKKSKNGTWNSGVLDQYPWDSLFATSWILRRLVPLNLGSLYGDEWNALLNNSANMLLTKVADPGTFIGTTEIQKFRIEAKVASALIKILELNAIENLTRIQVEAYIENWKTKSTIIINKLKFEEYDLSTCIALADVFIETNEYPELQEEIIRLEKKLIS